MKARIFENKKLKETIKNIKMCSSAILADITVIDLGIITNENLKELALCIDELRDEYENLLKEIKHGKKENKENK